MIRPWQDARVRRGMEKLLATRRDQTAAGDRAIGWKIAFGAPAFQEKLKLNGTLVGFLSQSRALESGGEVSLSGWVKPVAEPEVALYLGRDVLAGADDDSVRASIAKVAPAIELVDLEQPPEDVERILAGNISHRHVVLGPSASAEIEDLSARIFRRGDEIGSCGDVQQLPGNYVALLQHVAAYLDAFGERLKAGEFVICGSIVPPITLESDEVSFGYALDPVGEVFVDFSRP